MSLDPIRLIVDTDTAGGVVVSLLIGLLHPLLRLEVITVCAGNVEFSQQVEKALYTVERAGRGGEVPVCAGCDRPLVGPWVSADYVHGRDGMGRLRLPRARQRPEAQHDPAAKAGTGTGPTPGSARGRTRPGSKELLTEVLRTR